MTDAAHAFLQRLDEAATLPPEERHRCFCQLHDTLWAAYRPALQRIGPADAQRTASDGRTLLQVVGHIAEWERFLILAVGEVLAGVRLPRFMRLAGYVDTGGEAQEFASIDAFNAHQAAKHAGQTWEPVQALAIETATTLHTLFTQSGLLTAARLERTQTIRWRSALGTRLEVAAGWGLWLVALEHPAEHAADLGLAILPQT